MKTFLLLAAALATVDGSNTTMEKEIGGNSTVKDHRTAGTPWLPFFALPELPTFSLSGLRLPQLPGFSVPNALPDAVKVKATKTEYIEVTRRQTIHPVCYTMYENKSPCLPYRSYDDEEPEMDVDVQHQITFSSDGKNDMSDNMKPVKEVLEMRNPKYLQFIRRTEKVKETAKPAELEGSEIRTVTTTATVYPFPRPATEYVTTTTVLLTKLEKYTDHRVTATMAALNCYPVDPSIQRCRRQDSGNPIVEIPIRGTVKKPIKTGGSAILISPVVRVKSTLEDEDKGIEKTVEAVKKVAESVRIQAERLRSEGVDEDATESQSIGREGEEYPQETGEQIGK